ncbi:hypothetical protein BKA65DRAFT_37492 [Rhexocercosporidium sp. MPI-PUGE-AT-0058]|nr:hypothetical protein BKA65DRAFT_37492 [Rhexocercosporidium sp. MPI-PUGE-AT-0058]
MSLLPDELEDGSDSNPYHHSADPEVLPPAEVIENIVSRANDLISDHRKWLANLPFQKEEVKRQIVASPQPDLSTLISPLIGKIAGPSPLPLPGAIRVLPPPKPLPVPSQVITSQAEASAVASASIASLQSALNSANSALASGRQSASIALGIASASLQAALNSASIQSQSALAATQSASLAISSAQSSADQAVADAQSTASASVLSANNELLSVQASASMAVQRANVLASGAQETATNAIAQAQATISAVASQASAAIAASRLSAMNRTTFVLVVTFSVLGSSLITILLFYLIVRYRRNRRIQRQDELKSKIRRKRHESEESDGPSLSEFPLPINRTQWSRANSEERNGRTRSVGGGNTGYWPRGNDRVSASDREREAWMRGASNMSQVAFPSPTVETRKTRAVGPVTREQERVGNRQRGTEPFVAGSSSSDGSLTGQTWSPSKDDLLQSQSATLVITPRLPTGMNAPSRDGTRDRLSNMVRKNTLTYDSEHPDRPPKFTTWLEQSFRNVSPFPTIGAVQTATPKVSKSVLGRQSVRVGKPSGERGDSDGSAIIGAAI